MLNYGLAKLVGPASWSMLDLFIINIYAKITSCRQTSTAKHNGSSLVVEVSQ